MNKKYLISIHMILIGFMIGVINAFAARRIITFEMGESGQTVSFLMSKEEIAFADAVREHAKTSDATATSKPIKTLVDRVEMPESGQYIEFPVTNKADYGAIRSPTMAWPMAWDAILADLEASVDAIGDVDPLDDCVDVHRLQDSVDVRLLDEIGAPASCAAPTR